MNDILVVSLWVLFGGTLFWLRRPLGIAAAKFGFPPFFQGNQEARIRLFGMIGFIQALIALGLGGLLILSRLQ